MVPLSVSMLIFTSGVVYFGACSNTDFCTWGIPLVPLYCREAPIRDRNVRNENRAK
jgi:hypothetical protein